MSIINDYLKFRKDNEFVLTDFSCIREYMLRHTVNKKAAPAQIQKLTKKVVCEIERAVYG